MTDRQRCCCNCGHCIRSNNGHGGCINHCDLDGHYIGYLETFEGWCRRWKSDPTWKDVKINGQ